MQAPAFPDEKSTEEGQLPPLVRKIRAVNPYNAVAAYNAGLEALDHELEEDALRLLEAAIRHNPQDARLWQVTALLHRQLGDLAPAIAGFERAAALAPADARIAHSLARSRQEAGLPSVEHYQRARRLAPLDADMILGLAASLTLEVSAEAAMALLEETLREHPGWLAGHDALASFRWQQGDRAGFVASVERVLATDPANLPFWQGLIVRLIHGELYDRALEAIARGRAAAGPNVLFDANEAVCYSELGQADRADALFSRLGELDDSTLRIRHVRHLLRTGRPADAAALAEPMIGTPDAFLFWPYVSLAWRLIGDPRWDWLEGDERLVGVYDLADKIPSLPALAARLRSLHLSRHQPLEQSLRGGTQTDGALFSRIEPEIRALHTAIVSAVETHIAQLPPPQPDHPTLIFRRSPVRFAGSWSVRLTGAGFHVNHVHPQGWLSSAFYVSLPDEAMGGPDHAGWLSLGEATELGLDLPPVRLIEPKPARLVLFPSIMWHGTRPFAAGERLTVAFDVARPRQP